MNRMTKVFAGFLLVMAPLASAQEAPPAPQFPEDALVVQQLIAWSRLQNPQPAPEPMPPRDAPVPQPDQQGKRPADPQTPQERAPAAQSFAGKIIKNGNKFVLKSAGASYELQAQDDLQQYESQNVKIIGNLDTGSNTIRVVKIELLS
jgi:hypothetical protein